MDIGSINSTSSIQNLNNLNNNSNIALNKAQLNIVLMILKTIHQKL